MRFNLSQDKSNYRVDFVLEGKRKRFYPGTSDELIARNILRRMEFDWEQGQFDLSLNSYRLKNRIQRTKTTVAKEGRERKTTLKLLTLWDKWVTSLNLPERVKNDHYHCCRVMLLKANPNWDDVAWLLQSNLSASTWNTRRRFIKSCVSWALAEGIVEGKNPWNALKARKTTRTRANPLTNEETKLIIQAFERNQFCSLHSPCKHSYYVPYLKFLLLTAARPGEVIALQWKHIDFENNLIEISEAMGRDLESSPYATRKVRKETKTGEVRYLPMNSALRDLLVVHKTDDAKADSLVFLGARGKGILDIRAFREAWKKVLDGLGLEYRKPYQTRHTALSHIAQNHGLLAAAKVAGHKSLDMVSRHYARFTGDLKDVMPEF
jgi:integrase